MKNGATWRVSLTDSAIGEGESFTSNMQRLMPSRSVSGNLFEILPYNLLGFHMIIISWKNKFL